MIPVADISCLIERAQTVNELLERLVQSEKRHTIEKNDLLTQIARRDEELLLWRFKFLMRERYIDDVLLPVWRSRTLLGNKFLRICCDEKERTNRILQDSRREEVTMPLAEHNSNDEILSLRRTNVELMQRCKDLEREIQFATSTSRQRHIDDVENEIRSRDEIILNLRQTNARLNEMLLRQEKYSLQPVQQKSHGRYEYPSTK